MPYSWRMLCGSAVCTASLAAMLFGWSCRTRVLDQRQPNADDSTSGQSAGPSKSELLQATEQMLTRVRIAVERSTIRPDLRGSFMDTFSTTAKAIILADPKPYIALHKAMGAEVSPADARGPSIEAWWDGFSSEVRNHGLNPPRGDATSLFAYLWSHPDERNARVVGLPESPVRIGTGLVASWDLNGWEYTGSFGNTSLFLFSNDRRPVAAIDMASEDPGLNQWVQFKILLGDGDLTELRLTFYYNAQHERWVPFALIGGQTSERFHWFLY